MPATSSLNATRRSIISRKPSGSDPVVVSPYDAELFGHWWHEGPVFLEQVMRQSSLESSRLRLVSLSEVLLEFPDPSTVEPTGSSWGDEGYYRVWLNENNQWLYRHQHWAERGMVDLADRFPDVKGIVERGLNQAGRELLLAQSSDWAFHLTAQNSAGYAQRRFDRPYGRISESCETGYCAIS